MSKHITLIRPLFIITLASMTLVGCEGINRGLQSMRLPSCSSEGSVFENEPFDDWDDLYHKQVDKVIEAHLHSMNTIGNEPMKCTDEEYATRVPASAALTETATMVPAWSQNIQDLHETDMQNVLLEFLRVYECSMEEYSLFLPVHLSTNANSPITSGKLNEEQTIVRTTVLREKTIARESLGRALALVAGFDRLQPLSLDIECLKRSSLDLRNVLGLASDASSCLPRIWDAKGSLRDLAE